MATLNFKGKPFVQNHHLLVKYHELVPKKDKSLTDKVSLHDNLIIHGDNLKALKALLPTYAGKVKCIYIDPPYNTGNERWVYNDNVNSPMMQEWLGKVVDQEDLTRHDKWLCMMTPRLRLLRELLKEDGTIFISIDDNEQHHLRMLMDEIFGEENFITKISWQRKKESSNDSKNISIKAEYILVYSKSELSQLHLISLSEDYIKSSYKEANENFPDGKWRPVPIATTKGHKSGGYTYQIVTPAGKKHLREWAFPEDSYKRLLKQGRIYFGKDDCGVPQRVIYAHESEGIPASNIWNNLWDNVATNKQGKKEILEIFGDNVFDTPKPTALINRILELATDRDSIVLDSFAGSGTTGHSVLQLNKSGEGDRKFILVQIPEKIEKDKPAYKMGFREVVEIAAERVRRVIKGIQKVKDENLKKGLGGTFSYFELGKPIEMESILSGENLPTYTELARYIFYTATGEEFDESAVNEKHNFIGESKDYEVFLFYKPDIEYLRNTALTLDQAKALGDYKNKKRLVFAPTKYLDNHFLDELRITFAQLPFEIYKLTE